MDVVGDPPGDAVDLARPGQHLRDAQAQCAGGLGGVRRAASPGSSAGGGPTIVSGGACAVDRRVVDPACLLCHPCPFRCCSERMGRATSEIRRPRACGERDLLQRVGRTSTGGVSTLGDLRPRARPFLRSRRGVAPPARGGLAAPRRPVLRRHGPVGADRRGRLARRRRRTPRPSSAATLFYRDIVGQEYPRGVARAGDVEESFAGSRVVDSAEARLVRGHPHPGAARSRCCGRPRCQERADHRAADRRRHPALQPGRDADAEPPRNSTSPQSANDLFGVIRRDG